VDLLLDPTARRWAALIGASAVLLVGVFLLVWLAGSRYGKRKAAGTTKDDTSRARTKDRLLFAAALLAGLTVYAGFAVGSYQGLTGFARDFIHWSDWRQNIVPVTLDGGTAAFGFLAFRSVQLKKSALLCYIVVLGSTGASAVFNFTEGAEHAWQAGAFLAYLAWAGMAMGHVFLEQFKKFAGLGRYVKYGVRWLTSPHSTACAALAWVNYPPEDGTEATVRNGLAHLSAVRARKHSEATGRRAARAMTGGITLRPWARLTAVAETLATVTAELSDSRAERASESARRAEAETRVETLEANLAEMAETVRALRSEMTSGDPSGEGAENPAETPLRLRRSTSKRTLERPLRAVPSGATVSDEEAVQRLLRAEVSDDDKQPGYAWSKNKAVQVSGVGWGRINDILRLLAETRASGRSANPSGGDRSTGSDDSEERAG
jgi:hypothetical protein